MRIDNEIMSTQSSASTVNQESASIASLLYNGKGSIVTAPPAQWLQPPAAPAPAPPAPPASVETSAPKPKKRKRVSRKKDPIAEAVKLLKQAITAAQHGPNAAQKRRR